MQIAKIVFFVFWGQNDVCVCFGGGGLFNPLWYIFLIKSNLEL